MITERERETDRQTDRQTDREKETEGDRDRQTGIDVMLESSQVI